MTKKRLQSLKQIVELRDVQERAAQSAAASATAALSKVQKDLATAQRERADEYLAWAQVFDGNTIDLQAAQQWSASLMRRGHALQQINVEIAEAKVARDEANNGWNRACARTQGAVDLKNKALKAVKRHAEDERLADLADRLAGWRHHEG